MSTRAMNLARLVGNLTTSGTVPTDAIAGTYIGSGLAGTVSNSSNLSSVSAIRGQLYYVTNTGQGFYWYDGSDWNKITTT